MSRKRGFTLIELIVGLAGGLLIFVGLLNIFTISQRALAKGNDIAEVAQNGRITLERLSRELRQAEELVTNIPEDSENPASQVEFQDGHNPTELTYIRYYINNNALHRELSYYSLSTSPGVRVHFRAIDENGNPATKTVTEDEIIAEYIQSVGIWGTNLIQILVTLQKNTVTTVMSTSLYGRNLR